MQPCTRSLAPQVPSIEELIQQAKTFVAAAKAPATLKAYRNDWRDFRVLVPRSSVTVASLDAGDRCPLHCGPRLYFGVGQSAEGSCAAETTERRPKS